MTPTKNKEVTDMLETRDAVLLVVALVRLTWGSAPSAAS